MTTQRKAMIIGVFALLGLGVLNPSAAAAPAPSKAAVVTSGLVACLYPPPIGVPGAQATRVRFQAANGEAHDATPNGFNYSVTFTRVPPGGEVVNVYVTCFNRPSFGRQFTLNAPSGRQSHNIY
jgi:hypothetical protein